MENKNLKGLFNLIRKEFKDVRREIQVLEASVASFTGAINVLQGKDALGFEDSDGVLVVLKRLEAVLERKTDAEEVASGARNDAKLGDRESILLRCLLQDSGDRLAMEDVVKVDANVRDEESMDRKTYTPESSEDSTSSDSRISRGPSNSSIVAPTVQTRDPQTVVQDTFQDKSRSTSTSTESSEVDGTQVDQRLHAMSSQIEILMAGQIEVMKMLKDLTQRELREGNSPLIVPPPRKVGRKVVGFVYEDDD